MTQILGVSNINIERAEQIAQALCWYERNMDFADALHLALAANAERFVTFDKGFAKSATAQHLHVELL